MTRLQWLLIATVVAELAVGAVVLSRPRTRVVPPVADLSFVDAPLAEQLRARITVCETPDEWAAIGEDFLAYGYFPEGEACYRVAAEREPERAERAYQWAFALERIGKLEEANTQYDLAAKLGFAHPEDCRYFAGRNFLRLERADEARAAFEAAGEQPSARYERARLLARGGRPDEAISITEKLSREYPQAIQPYLLRHRIAALRDGPEAAKFADLATRAPGRLPTPFENEWNRLEGTYFRLGLTAELEELGRQFTSGRGADAEPRLRAILASEWNPGAADLLAEVEAQRGRKDEAARLLQDALDRAGPSVHLLERVGDAREANGQEGRALHEWTRAADFGLGGPVKSIHFRLSDYYRKKGNAPYADSRAARGYLASGHELYWAANPRGAFPAFQKAVELEPTLAAAWFYLGETNRLLGKPDEARAAYNRCLAINPDFGRAITGLGLLPKGPVGGK